MPMLAERRRKTKWTNPGRQALWKRDSGDTKFGREMMEKMGWKVGQGLGANEQGIKEPLRLMFKNDNKGMGYKENDNEWIQQQCEFDELLSKLSSDKKESCTESQTNTVQSLEERSRLSKARVHYQKFTRGKDLAKYSKKDLECILGRNEKESPDIKTSVEGTNDNIGTMDKSLNLVTAGSMVDYFAKKMQSKKEKKQECVNVNPEEGETLLQGSNTKDELEENVVNAPMELHEKKKKSKRKKEKYKDKDGCNEEACDEIDFNNLASDCKMKTIPEEYKESKKTKIAQADDQSNPLDEGKDCENIITKNEIIGMAKEERNVHETNLEGSEVPGEKLKKKKKKRKREENPVEEFDTENVQALNVIENKDEEYKEAEEKVNCLTSDETLKKKKKTSKRNREVIVDEDDAGDLKEKIKKKKKCLEAENFFNEGDCTTNKSELNTVPDADANIKKSKRKKTKTICESAVEDERGNEKDERKRRKETEEEEDSLFYKREFLKKEYSLKNTNRNKLLNLIYCTNVEQFSGSNLGGLSGYGIVSHR